MPITITLTAQAQSLLQHYFSDAKALTAIRIYMPPRDNYKQARRLALKPDTAGERDIQKECNGYTFLISRHILPQIQNIFIDAKEGGLMVYADPAQKE